MNPPSSASASTDPTERLQGWPPYHADLVEKVAEQVELRSVELLTAHFRRADQGPVPDTAPLSEAIPQIGIDAEWEVARSLQILGCRLSFGTLLPEPEAYSVFARYRLVYSTRREPAFSPEDLQQFVWWDATFVAWPYWREHLSATLGRARLPKFDAPLLPTPLPRSSR